MTKLTDTQRVILSAAAQRTDRLALPLPKSLKGGAGHRVVNALVEKGLLKEVKANRKLNDPVWRETDDGRLVTLVITDAGLAAIGIETEVPKEPATEAAPPSAPKERKPREGTKQEAVLALLRRDQGATIVQICEATAWQQHSARGFLAALKKKGIAVTVLERVRQVGLGKEGARGSYSVYRVEG